jgi:uncharacterized protein YecA (UPF0149 family)
MHNDLLQALEEWRPLYVENGWIGGRGESGSATKVIGRNDPYPCGSGKKYKRCCGGATVT